MTSTNRVKNLAFKLREKRREKRRLASGKKDIEVIDLETVPSPTAKEAVKWASGLTIEDEKILLNDAEWLTDRKINASQRLIKECYPHVCGLQDVSLGHTLAFDVPVG